MNGETGPAVRADQNDRGNLKLMAIYRPADCDFSANHGVAGRHGHLNRPY